MENESKKTTLKLSLICPTCGHFDSIDYIAGSTIYTYCARCNTKMVSNKTKTKLKIESPNILNEAFHTINEERQDSYGKPEDSFQIIAEFWTTYIKHKFGIKIILKSLDVGHLMSLFKHARMLGQKPAQDNYRDAAGYLDIVADRLIRWPESFDPEEL